MYRSRPLIPRPDLRPLAEHLDHVEGRATWHADPPGSLTPVLEPRDGTSLTLPEFTAELRTYLSTAAPAWDPLAGR
jgi:hypothetical protein